MGSGKNIRLSSIVLFLLAVALAVLSTPDLIYGQSGIEMEVEGNATVGQDVTVGGELYALYGITSLSNVSAFNIYAYTSIEGPSITAANNVTATMGNVTATFGDITATNGDVTAANGTVSGANVTASNNVTATNGNVTATNGKITAPNGKVGIGTSDVPKGGIGGGRLAIHGPNGSDVDGPHIQTTVQADNYPVSTLFSSNHDNCGLLFDCYKDGPFRSSYLSSNLIIWKFWNYLLFSYACNTSRGTEFVPQTGFAMNLTDGSIALPYVYGDTVGATNRDLYIDNTGKLGYLPSSIEFKENVRDATEQDTGWIYALRPVMFDYKDRTMGENQCGLIAEEVATVNTRIVSYKREISYGPEQLDGNGQPTGYHPMIVTITTQPETVCYDQLTVPMLAEIQRLKRRVDELEARVAQLETLEARVAALEARN